MKIINRVPYSMVPQELVKARAFVALADTFPEWFNLTIQAAVGFMMSHSHGVLQPSQLAFDFEIMVHSAGLVPLTAQKLK